MKKKWLWISMLGIALVVTGISTLATERSGGALFTKKTTINFQMTDSIIHNPLIGFAPDAMFADEEGDDTLVYVDITFRELWPEKDTFAFEKIEKENKLEEWRKKGKHLVLRFIADYPQPEEHLDIPDWLFEETGGDGDFYDHAYGKGYSPNYSNPAFIDYHAQAIQALGERYGGDTFVSYVQLGSLGHWGEWHTSFEKGVRQLPLEATRRQYVLPYLSAFPYAKLLMRRPFRIAGEFNLGLYNDMAGHPHFTQEWLEWIEKGGDYDQTFEENELISMKDAWKTAPIGGEFTSDIPMVNLLVTNLDQTVKMIRDSHTSFLGPKVPDSDPYSEKKRKASFYEGAGQVLHALGYRIGITKAVWLEPYFGNPPHLKLIWENSGTAPLYWDWPVFLYGYDADHEFLFQLPVEMQLSELLPGRSIQTKTKFPAGRGKDEGKMEEAAYLYVGIEDPLTHEPAVQLVSNQTEWNKQFLILRKD